ncbi:MAG: hypothetical protein ACREBW_00850 [Candidatus Micrarchaeaceae archaeon]
MKKILQGAFLLLLSGLCGLGFAQKAGSAKPSFTLTISTAKNTFASGANIDLAATQTNTSNHDIYFVVGAGPGGTFGNGTWMTVKDSQGNPVAETPFGHEKHGTGPHKHPLGGSVFSGRTLISPGKSFHYVIHLSKEYDLTRPGTYTVQAKMRDAWTPQYPWVTSNVLTITIK